MKLCIIGGGQLAMFLSDAALHYGYETTAISNDPTSSACTNSRMVDLKDNYAVANAMNEADVITFESENVPRHLMTQLSSHHHVYPSQNVMRICSDRLLEKQFLQKLRLPTATFFEITNINEYHEISANLNYHGILKSKQGGYDGNGQARLTPTPDQQIITIIESGAIIEAYVNYDYEISILCARNQKREFFHYPISKNEHRNGILFQSEAPYLDSSLQQKAVEYATLILTALDYVGLAAIEFFVKKGELIINEIAPRVHNSGHWTLDATNFSQFACHISCITGHEFKPLEVYSCATMVNIIGKTPPQHIQYTDANIQVYDYQKTPRPARKCGHITITSPMHAINQDAVRYLQNKGYI